MTDEDRQNMKLIDDAVSVGINAALDNHAITIPPEKLLEAIAMSLAFNAGLLISTQLALKQLTDEEARGQVVDLIALLWKGQKVVAPAKTFSFDWEKLRRDTLQRR